MIDAAGDWWLRGGPVMAPLSVLGLVTYALVAERLIALYGRHAAEEALAPRSRRRGLLVLRALVGAAPLLGLLGTVAGMISSFEGLMDGGRVTDISDGIGHALHSTQYGLALAVPGILAERVISRRSLQLELRRSRPEVR